MSLRLISNMIRNRSARLFLSGKSFSECKKHFSDEKSRKVPSTLADKYELFDEASAPVILDVEEEKRKISHEERVIDEFEGLNLKKGVTGVFDIEEIVELLRREKAEDLLVMKIPPDYHYVDYMVIVNGRSTRHMMAMGNFVRKLYKRKVRENSPIPHLEGKNSNLWMALDLGNIVLHLFSPSGRKLYDLDTLWAVGKNYDNLSNEKFSSLSQFSTNYAKLLAELRPNS